MLIHSHSVIRIGVGSKYVIFNPKVFGAFQNSPTKEKKSDFHSPAVTTLKLDTLFPTDLGFNIQE